MRLNVGCGTDYRNGFINIDGSASLSKIDKVIDIGNDSLLNYFEQCSVEFILANDIIEHHYHWKAVEIMSQFHCILKPEGIVEIRVPDAEYIINSWRLSLTRKLNLLFGGQDIPQGKDLEMDASRKLYPQFFCHKFGWTRNSMREELAKIGFASIKCERAGTNFIAIAQK